MIPRALSPVLCAALAAFGLGACTAMPDLPGRDDPAIAQADYPTFLTIGQMRAVAAAEPARGAQVAAAVDARAAALQNRARRLQATPVVDDEARARLDGATGTD